MDAICPVNGSLSKSSATFIFSGTTVKNDQTFYTGSYTCVFVTTLPTNESNAYAYKLYDLTPGEWVMRVPGSEVSGYWSGTGAKMVFGTGRIYNMNAGSKSSFSVYGLIMIVIA